MSNIVWHDHQITAADRASQKKQKPCVLWFTGLSGSGKSTIANAVDEKLVKLGYHTFLLDGDNVRHGLCGDLGFSDDDRKENIRRIGEVAKLFADAGLITLTAFISPFINDRKLARDILPEGAFIEVYVDTPLHVCESRDPKGLYKKARSGEIKHFTGIDSPYEAPGNAELTIKTDEFSVDACADQVVAFMRENGYLLGA